MAVEKSLQTGSTTMLVLSLLAQEDMYGYQMIEVLSERSDCTFELKAGTLYPLLKLLEDQGYITSYEQTTEAGRLRKYYHITDMGKDFLQEKKKEWMTFSQAVERVLKGGSDIAKVCG